MTILENMSYSKQREWVTEQELKGYRALCTGIFQQAVTDATDRTKPVDIFLDAYAWLLVDGYYFLTEILGMHYLDRSRYDNFLAQLKSGNYIMYDAKFKLQEELRQ